MVPSYLRAAAGVCLVSTGLFLTGGGVAVATPDTQDNTAQAGNSPSGAFSHGAPTNRRAGKAPASSGSTAGNSTAARTGNGRFAGGIARRVLGGANRVTSTSSPSTSAPEVAPTPSTYVGSTQGPGASAIAATDVPESVGAAMVAAGDLTTATIAAGRPVTQLPAAIPTVPIVTTVPSALPGQLTLGKVLQPLGSFVENMTSALLGPQALQPIMNAANQLLAGMTAPIQSASVSPRVSNQLPTPVAEPSQSAPTPSLSADQPGPVLPGLSHVATVAGLSQVAPSSVPAMTPQLLSDRIPVTPAQPAVTAPVTPPTANSWISGIATQIFHGVREALRNVSLTELALAALPGAVGLIFFFATGVGLGRRQAKFGFAMASSGAVRFAVRGPLGVVRSGSSVAVHSRKAPATPAEQVEGVQGSRRRHLKLVDRAA